MNYIFIPEITNKSGLTNEDFLRYQIMYKQLIEKMLFSSVNASSIDKYIANNNLSIPTVDDADYNFYHKYSLLGSKYLFLRNNIHIERLNNDEIEELKNNPSNDFFNRTFKKVLFESDNSFTYFGSPSKKNEVKSNSLIFEFAYDLKKVTSMDQINEINKLLVFIDNYVNEIATKIRIPISILEYNAIPDLYISSKKDDINGSYII